LAFELVAAVDSTAQQRLIPGLIDDPSLELRRDAVAMAIAQAETALAAGNKAQATQGYRRAFGAARDLDQIKETSDKLKMLGVEVDLPAHMGFVMQWKVVGPFNNAGTKGFAVEYPPETTPFSATAEFPALMGVANWMDATSTDPYGLVDLNKALGERKGVVGYAYAEFVADKDQQVDIRIGCLNASKVWINGKLLLSNEVYHAGFNVDQYIGQATLKKGKNVILVKVAQNEQTDAWAKDWMFQLRVCDSVGTAVLSADRLPAKGAE
jgi:hypothetical protein